MISLEMIQLQNFRVPILFKKEEKEIGCHNGIYISFFINLQSV